MLYAPLPGSTLHSPPVSSSLSPAVATSAPDKRRQLDRLYQRLTDDLDALLSAVGLKTAA